MADRIDVYAQAILDIVHAEGHVDEVEDELFRFARIVEGNDDLRMTISNPGLPLDRRAAIVDELLEHRALPTTRAIATFIVAAGRGHDLPAIVNRFVELAAQTREQVVAEVRSRGRRSTTAQKARIAEALSRTTGKRVEVKVVVDESVLGGIVATIGDTVIDGTVRHRLDQLKETNLMSRASASGPTERRAAVDHDRRVRHRGGAAQERRRLPTRRSRASRSVVCSRSATASPGSPGLPNAAVNELLEFEGGALGLALNLEEDNIGAVVLGKVDAVEEGPARHRDGPHPLDPGRRLADRPGRQRARCRDRRPGPVSQDQVRRLEIQAPGITGRQPVHEPLQTGIKAIDAMTPIGRGQRELIIGDRKTGKTTVAIDTILNQKGQGVKCIYVAIGQKGSTVAQTVETLREHGALEYTVVVSAPASDEAVFKYLAPYSGCAIGQHWMENGEAALVVYDDLSKQAEAYRQIALLLRRPPGREAYPGDVFYLHSRLLERAGEAERRAWAPVRSPRCRSSRPRPATCRRTSRPT